MAIRVQKSTPPLLAMAFAAYLRRIGSPVERYMLRNGLPVLCEDPMLGWRVGAYIGDQNLNSGLLRKLGTAPTLLLALRGLVQIYRPDPNHLIGGTNVSIEQLCCQGVTRTLAYRCLLMGDRATRS